MKIKHLLQGFGSMERPAWLPDMAQISAPSSTSLVSVFRKYLIYTSLERSMEIVRRNLLAFSTLTLIFQAPLFLYGCYRGQIGNGEENVDSLMAIILNY